MSIRSFLAEDWRRDRFVSSYMKQAVAGADQLVAIASRMDSANDKKGGYLALGGYCDVPRTAKIGIVPPEKDEKYSRLAPEKVYRVHLTGDASSWLTRDEKQNRWGGAIRGRKFIYGFSGFPELWDEAIVLELAVILHDLSVRKAHEIAKMSGNGYFDLLHTTFANFISAAK